MNKLNIVVIENIIEKNKLRNRYFKKINFSISKLEKIGLLIPFLDFFIFKNIEKRFLEVYEKNGISQEEVCEKNIENKKPLLEYGFNLFLHFLNLFIFILLLCSPNASLIGIIIQPIVLYYMTYVNNRTIKKCIFSFIEKNNIESHKIEIENNSCKNLDNNDFKELVKSLDEEFICEWLAKNNFKITYKDLDTIIADLKHRESFEYQLNFKKAKSILNSMNK